MYLKRINIEKLASFFQFSNWYWIW